MPILLNYRYTLLCLGLLCCLLHRNLFAIDSIKLQRSFLVLGGNPDRFLKWERLLEFASSKPIPLKLQQVNDFFNQEIAYSEDLDNWGEADYWATPMESLARAKADCEDYVIAKYFTLRNMHIPDSQLRLIYVKAKVNDSVSANRTTTTGRATATASPDFNLHSSLIAHMVLAYYPPGQADPLILDNLNPLILPASKRQDLIPVFSFNSLNLFPAGAGPGSKQQARSAPKLPIQNAGISGLSRWQDLLQRAHAEGFDE